MNASLLVLALFRIQLPGSRERHTKMGVMLMTKFGRTLGATVAFLNLLYTNTWGYKLGCRRSRSTLGSSLKDSKVVFEELFKGPNLVFVAHLVPELFTRLRILNVNRL